MEYREKINVNELVAEYVDKCEQKYDPSSNRRNEKSQKAYKESLDAMKDIDLGNLTEKDTNRIEQIVHRYLYDWGAMARVLGKDEFRNWQSKLTRAIQSNHNHRMLKDFSCKDLMNVDLSQFKDKIESCFESLSGTTSERVVGRVAATKVLHLICPDFFPAWDNDIAAGVRDEFPKKDDKGNRIEAFSPDDYYRFMQVIQNFLKEHEDVWSSLANYYGKSKLRIIDECLFWAVRRPFYLFSFRG